MEKICIVCNKIIIKKSNESNKYWNKKKYCSYQCKKNAQIGVIYEKRRTGKIMICLVCSKKHYVIAAKIRKKEGQYCSRKCARYSMKGKKLTEAQKKKLSKPMNGKHHLWKGNEVGYCALHNWVKRWKGKPQKCSKCKAINRIQWANKSHEYKRELDDWIPLCSRCHFVYDGIGKKMWQTRRKNQITKRRITSDKT